VGWEFVGSCYPSPDACKILNAENGGAKKTKSVKKWQIGGKFWKYQIISIPQNHYNLL